jgi:hypothetical protein
VDAVDLLGPVEARGLQVELPAADLRQLAGLLQQLGRALHLRLGRLAPGQVHVRAGHPHGDAELVALDDLAAAQQPDPVAVLVPDPELAFVGRGLAAEVRLDRGEHARPVDRMDDAVPLAAQVPISPGA